MLTIPIEKAEDVANSIRQSGKSALAVPGDMLNDAYHHELVKKAAEFGNGKIHIIVNSRFTGLLCSYRRTHLVC